MTSPPNAKKSFFKKEEEKKKKEHPLPPHKKEYWQNDLESLGIKPRRRPNDLNDKDELEALAEIIKQVYYQDYKTAYSDINNNCKT